VPVVLVAFGPALLFVVFSLFQAQNDSVNNFFPVLELNTTLMIGSPADQSSSGARESCSGIVQGVQRWKRLAGKLLYEFVLDFFV
jgi:hypothetical protein